MFPMKLASAKGYCDDQELDACQCLKRLKDSSGCLNCGTCLVYYFWCPFIIHLSPTSVCCGQLHNVLLCTPSMLPGRPSIVPTAFPDNPSPYHNILGPILLLLDNSWWEYARTFEVHDCLQDTKVAIHDGKYPQVCMNLVNYSKGAEVFILSCDVVEVEHLLGNPCLQSFQLSTLCHLPYNTQSGIHCPLDGIFAAQSFTLGKSIDLSTPTSIHQGSLSMQCWNIPACPHWMLVSSH